MKIYIHTEGGHFKFWLYEVFPTGLVVVTWGRLGTALDRAQTTQKDFRSEGRADEWARATAVEKMGKGYVPYLCDFSHLLSDVRSGSIVLGRRYFPEVERPVFNDTGEDARPRHSAKRRNAMIRDARHRKEAAEVADDFRAFHQFKAEPNKVVPPAPPPEKPRTDNRYGRPLRKIGF